jgi:predicted Zn finger-like uncharacterized protein
LIIQCPSCQARYNYDESRFAGASAKKIRCTRCTTIFQIVNPAGAPPAAAAPPPRPAPPPPPAEGKVAGLPGPDDFALDETALTEASKRKRAVPGSPARVSPLVPAPPQLLPADTPDATAPPPGFPKATTDRAAAVDAAGHERRLRLPVGHRYSLACIAGPEAGRIFEITKPRVVIGRAQADIVVGDIQCSRQHAAIEVLDENVFLVDLNSTNGTWVGEQRVTRVELENRAEFEIGTTTLMLIRSATEHGPG